MNLTLKIYILILICIIKFNELQAQNKTSNWYFGEGVGLTFSSSGISVNADGQNFYQEGMSAISDNEGNLLFYTDGQLIWDKNHQIMPNGDSIKGHYSSTQGSLIVKQPGTCNLYYVFTLDGKEHNFEYGLNYTIVDMDLNNGLGDVISKNNPLIGFTAEKLAGVYHANKQSVWIICHEMSSNNFYSYRLSNTGIESPVISAAGLPFTGPFYGIGQMKVSQQGDRIAYTAFVNSIIEVFDFDNATGKVSNPQTMVISGLEGQGGYGLEFSPNGRYLYASKFDIDYLNTPGALYQFDLSLNNINETLNNVIFIAHNKPPSDMRGLQLASDGKIYLSNSLSKYLGVINDPDKHGILCNYSNDGLSLNGGYAGWTLPNFVASYIPEKFQDLDSSYMSISGNCNALTIQFGYDLISPQTTYSWDFGDGSVSQQINPSHIYDAAGRYKITLISEYECKSDTIYKTLEIINCNNKVYIPNAFSPNGDGINDYLYVFGPGIADLDIEIFDRWGEKIFANNDTLKSWDGKLNGKPMNPGVYVYQANIKFENGETENLKGEVILIEK